MPEAKTFGEKKVYTSSLAVLCHQTGEEETDFDLEYTLYKMNDLFILTIPAELFSRFGLEMKQAEGRRVSDRLGMIPIIPSVIWSTAPNMGDHLKALRDPSREGTTEEIVAEILNEIAALR